MAFGYGWLILNWNSAIIFLANVHYFYINQLLKSTIKHAIKRVHLDENTSFEGVRRQVVTIRQYKINYNHLYGIIILLSFVFTFSYALMLLILHIKGAYAPLMKFYQADFLVVAIVLIIYIVSIDVIREKERDLIEVYEQLLSSTFSTDQQKNSSNNNNIAMKFILLKELTQLNQTKVDAWGFFYVNRGLILSFTSATFTTCVILLGLIK